MEAAPQQNRIESLNKILLEVWGYDRFRSVQLEIIESVLDGKDTLALLPTGGGKSICFQVPGIYLGGLTLVISPLIALMKDQILQLKKRNIKAAAIISGMTLSEIESVLIQAQTGEIHFLYLAPERINSRVFKQVLPRLPIQLIAIDEAHCISQWGYDFRPEYLQLQQLRDFTQAPWLALTATATPEVRKDIMQKLGFKKENAIATSFLRKNLAYIVIDREDKLPYLCSLLPALKGSGLIFVQNRRSAQEISDRLRFEGHNTWFYHAGLSTEERDKIQKAWINNEIRILVCTNAFGMGIDKPDVRFVFHWEAPSSLEAYFQEAGRAGRDGLPARAILLHHPGDSVNARKKIAQAFPELDRIRILYQHIADYLQIAEGAAEGMEFNFDISEFSAKFSHHPSQTFTILQHLAHGGYLRYSEASWLPSRFRFTTDRLGLQKFMYNNRQFDACIHFLLRSYGGIMDQSVGISEKSIAKAIESNEKDVFKMLHQLSLKGLAAYYPANKKPFLFFLQQRLDAKRVFQDPKAYQDLKKRNTDLLEAILSYLENKEVCRSIQLMQYLGDPSQEKCGQCDVCRGLNLPQPDDQQFAIMQSRMLEKVSKNLLKPEEVQAASGVYPPQQWTFVLRFLLEQGILKLNKDGKLVPNS